MGNKDNRKISPQKAAAVCAITLIMSLGWIFSQVNINTAQSRGTHDADALRQAKQQDALEKRQRKEQQDESERAHSEQLSEAKTGFEKVKARQQEAPAEYVNALTSLATAYQYSNDMAQANTYYNQALELLEQNFPSKELDKLNISSLWSLLRVVPEPEYRARFERLLKITELRFPSQADSLVLDGIRDREYFSHLDREAQIADRKKLWELAIRVRSSIYGANDYRLAPFIRQYGGEFEAGENVVEAEKQIRRSFDLTKPLNDDIKAAQQIELAQFYLRHQMREKMNDAFNSAVTLCRGHISMNVAYNFSSLTKAFSTSSYGGNPEKMISTLLANGDDYVVALLDPQIDELVNNYLDSGSLSRAEKLLRQRVEASDRCKSDPNAHEWRLRLSDTLLAQGRDAESNKLFDQVRNATALAGGSVAQMVSKREQLLERLGKAGQLQSSKQAATER